MTTTAIKHLQVGNCFMLSHNNHLKGEVVSSSDFDVKVAVYKDSKREFMWWSGESPVIPISREFLTEQQKSIKEQKTKIKEEQSLMKNNGVTGSNSPSSWTLSNKKSFKLNTNTDDFDCKVGSVQYRINECLTNFPKTIEEISSKIGLPSNRIESYLVSNYQSKSRLGKYLRREEPTKKWFLDK